MTNSPQHQPMYGWALNSQGVPVPIAAAQKGERYFCPVCHGDMVAKQGDVKQHHFAHLNLIQCTPENVARAVTGRWLVETLRQRLTAGQAVEVHWKAQEQQHTVNILQAVATVVEKHQLGDYQVDVALLDQDSKARVVILTEYTPPQEMITKLTENRIMVIQIKADSIRSGRINLETLLAEATVWGGWWLLDQKTLPSNLITDPKTLRTLLRMVANRPPYRFYGELQKEGELSHVLTIDGRKLWLPPEVWQNVVGGARNRFGSDIMIISQEWSQDDHSQIALYYVTVRDTAAVAIRYFPPNQPVTSDLGNAAFRRANVTALLLAEQLAGGVIAFPQ